MNFFILLGTSMVDVTLGGDKIDISDWSFLDFDSLSDHPFIFFKLMREGHNLNRLTTESVPKLKNLNKSRFLNLLTAEINFHFNPAAALTTITDVDAEINKIVECLASCARKSKKRSPQAKKASGLDWWSDTLSDLRNNLRKCLKTSCKFPTIENVASYKLAKAAFQRAIRTSKTESFQNFCSTNMNKDLFDCLKRLASHSAAPSIPNKLISNGLPVTNGKEIVDLLANSFFPKEKSLSVSHEATAVSVNRTLTSRHDSGPQITVDEVRLAVSESKANSSPGIDGLAAELVQYCCPAIENWLSHLYNCCLSISYFPVAWKTAKICVLRKSGKESYEDVKSYRPISLLNVLGKCFEKVIHSRLVWLSHVGGWISGAQHGFMENRSTETAAHDLVSTIENNFNKKVFTSVGFLDISSAFDATWPPSILNALIKKSCPLYIVKMIKSYLSDRVGLLIDGQKTYTHKIQIGCPQGSVLSPFLWNVLIDHILRCTFPFPHQIIAYADDIAIVTWDKDPHKSVSNLQEMCDCIVQCFKAIMLDINAQKTILMIFTRARSPLPNFKLKINNIEICPSLSTKFLGLELDHKLNWRKHIENKCTATKRLMHSIRRYMRLTWGLDTLKLKTLYTSTVIPTLLYGCSVWAGALKSKKTMLKLRSIQRIFLRYITRSYKSVSTLALSVISNSLPIDLKVLEITCNRYFLYKHSCFAPSSKKTIDSVLGKLGPISDIDQTKRFLSTNHPPWSFPKNVFLHPFDRNVNIPTTPPCRSTIHIFTDASKIGGGVGFSTVCSTTDGIVKTHQEKLPASTSVFQAECIAINYGISMLHSTSFNEDISCVHIYSDSQAALSAAASKSKSCSISADTHRQLLEAPWPVHLIWSPGHEGIEGNELADLMAKEAATSQLEASRAVPQEKRALLSTVKHLLRERWEEEWQSSEQGRQTREFFPSIDYAKVLENNFIHHELTQVLTGHSALNSHLHKIGIKTTPSCDCGAEEETVEHFVLICPLYSSQRAVIASACHQHSISFPPPLNAFATHETLWKSLAIFISLSKRLALPKELHL